MRLTWKRMIKPRKADLSSLLFACYFFAVWAVYIFVNRYKYGGDKGVFFLSILGCFVITFPLAFLFIRLVRKMKLDAKERRYQRKTWSKLAAAFFAANLFILLIWFAASFPGAFAPDSIDQYCQAVSGEYSDWHPFLHTFLFFTIPLKLTGQTASIVLFQVVYLAAALAYFSISICRYFGVKVALIANAYIILNPYTGEMAVLALKDVGFSIAALLIAVFVFNIYFSESEWLTKPLNLILLAIALTLCTLLRHNAILYTLFVVISVWVYSGRKLGARLLLLTLVLLIGVKGPIYHAFEVEKPGRRHTETMGVPLTIMANVVKEGAADGLCQSTVDFLYGIASKEQYEEEYETGNFNALKHYGTVHNLDVIEQTDVADILSMTGECILKYPACSAKAFFMLTDMVYALDGGIEGERAIAGVSENDYGIEYQGNRSILELLENYKWAFYNSPLKYFRYIGSTVFLMLAFILGRCSFSRKADWQKILMCVPILVYDFGTMLLLTGPDSRFFFVNFLVCPIVLLIALGDREMQEVEL